jgi:sulfatase modifying factor 1
LKAVLKLVPLLLLVLALTGCNEEVAPGEIIIISQPREAKVSLNNEPAGTTPLVLEADPGIYILTISKEGYEVWEEVVEIELGKQAVIEAELIPIPTEEDIEKTAPEVPLQEASADKGETELAVEVREPAVGDRLSHVLAEEVFGMMPGVEFGMILAPAARFPFGIDDQYTAAVEHEFWIGETEVTYELWVDVMEWAVANGYRFHTNAYRGSENHFDSSDKEPVTNIQWEDAIVWCNALTEYYSSIHGTDLIPVYRTKNNSTLRSPSLGWPDNIYRHEQATGFRLPTAFEWQLAARYLGPNQPTVEPIKSDAILIDGLYWLPGRYASGADAPVTDLKSTEKVAWFDANVDGLRPYDPELDKTQPVAMKQPNTLGLYDMSGNVGEWIYDYEEPWHEKLGNERFIFGSSYSDSAERMTVGGIWLYSLDGLYKFINVGFRIARNK